MARKVVESSLNASTVDILNVIRANASMQYQDMVPKVEIERDIPRVGEVLLGTPALANEFINALINRIALVRVRSAVFNNPYVALKKGYLEFGETVEEVFVNISKAVEFSAEKAEKREFKRYLPDVRSAFHVMNFRVMYPVTIQDEDLRMAFTSVQGVQDMIARIVDSVYTSAAYDEYLLFKYMMIRAITHGEMYPVSFDGADPKNAAKAFRGISNLLTFMGTKYNASGVHTVTPREDQYIFMDAEYNAGYDVDVLASAFNMDKANFMGRLFLIDDWKTFDNDRFSVIMENSDQIDPITPEELAIMEHVKAVIIDGEWFQVYDNISKFTETYLSSGLYWNYFYHTWKTVSSSPFSNAVVFIDEAAPTLSAIKATVDSKSVDEHATVLTFTVEPQPNTATLSNMQVKFNQDEALTQAGIAVQRYGAVIIPDTAYSQAVTLTADVNGVTFTAGSTITNTANVGDTVTLNAAVGMAVSAQDVAVKESAKK